MTTKTVDKAAAKADLMVALQAAVVEAYKTGDDSEVGRLIAAIRRLG